MQLLQARVDQRAMTMKGTLHSPMLQHYWKLTIRLFSVISGTLAGGGLRLLQWCFGVFYSPSQQGKQFLWVFHYLRATPSLACAYEFQVIKYVTDMMCGEFTHFVFKMLNTDSNKDRQSETKSSEFLPFFYDYYSILLLNNFILFFRK